jgi:Arm DNA-binding domain/Phage integrase, N-terminal SAM-like domain
MIGTITKRARQDGKPAWGYSFFAGRSSAGKRIQITRSGFDTRKEAADALRKAIEQRRLDGDGANHLTVSAFLDRWLDEYAKHRCTAKTLERYVTLARYATNFLGESELQKLAPLEIESMLINLLDSGGRKDETHPNGRPLSPRTVRHIAFLMHDSFESAVRWDLLPANPMDRVVLPKAEKKEAWALDKQGLSQVLGAVRGTTLPTIRHGRIDRVPAWGTSGT